MLAKTFDLEESKMYDGLTDELLNHWLSNPQKLNLDGDSKRISYHTNKQAFNPSESVKIRLLFNSKLNINFQTQTNPTSYMQVEKAIIHFHGGGFCSSSSGAHQNYTRIWAIEMGIPIFSVDYRLAPDYPYPHALNDCYQGYVWIVTQAKV